MFISSFHVQNNPWSRYYLLPFHTWGSQRKKLRAYCWVRVPNQDLCWDLNSRSLIQGEPWIHRKDLVTVAFWNHFTSTPTSYLSYFYEKRKRKLIFEGKQSLKALGAFVQIFLIQYLWNRYNLTSFLKMKKFLRR